MAEERAEVRHGRAGDWRDSVAGYAVAMLRRGADWESEGLHTRLMARWSVRASGRGERRKFELRWLLARHWLDPRDPQIPPPVAPNTAFDRTNGCAAAAARASCLQLKPRTPGICAIYLESALVLCDALGNFRTRATGVAARWVAAAGRTWTAAPPANERLAALTSPLATADMLPDPATASKPDCTCEIG